MKKLLILLCLLLVGCARILGEVTTKDDTVMREFQRYCEKLDNSYIHLNYNGRGYWTLTCLEYPKDNPLRKEP